MASVECGEAAVLDVVVQGLAVGVALAAPLGPINVEIVRRALRDGFLSGWLVGLGAVSADTIYCALVVGGLAPLADRVALRVPLYLAGVVVLGYLGVSGIRSALSGDAVAAAGPTARASYVTGFLMAAASPMGIVYWLSIGAALVASAVERSGRDAAPLLVAGVFAGIVCWVTFLSGLAQVGRRFVSDGVMRILTGVGGVVLVGFAVWFAVAAGRALAAL
jgi:threonine/homoserine/homoserine lactone efflux protein